jgi:hypothetical protein
MPAEGVISLPARELTAVLRPLRVNEAEIIEPEVVAGHAPVTDASGAVSAGPVGWRTLARKP